MITFMKTQDNPQTITSVAKAPNHSGSPSDPVSNTQRVPKHLHKLKQLMQQVDKKLLLGPMNTSSINLLTFSIQSTSSFRLEAALLLLR
jgi:hypothetical protein